MNNPIIIIFNVESLTNKFSIKIIVIGINPKRLVLNLLSLVRNCFLPHTGHFCFHGKIIPRNLKWCWQFQQWGSFILNSSPYLYNLFLRLFYCNMNAYLFNSTCYLKAAFYLLPLFLLTNFNCKNLVQWKARFRLQYWMLIINILKIK